MGRVSWTESALIDQQEAILATRKDSSAAARKLRAAIQSATRQLRAMPRLGSMIPDFEHDRIRELYVHPYRVFYKIQNDNDDCLVVAIIHSHRSINRILHQRGLLPPDSAN